MSAFVVSQSHINALVNAGLTSEFYGWYWNGEWHKLTYETADRTGAMLLAENVRSVGYRYSEPGREQIYGEGWTNEDDGYNLPGRYVTATVEGVAVSAPEYLQPFTFRRGKPLAPVGVLKAISCLDYQSCETPDWKTTEAFAFCEYLKDHMIGKLPGYADEAWEVSRDGEGR